METPKPLTKSIYETAKKIGIETITLHFSGGNDEGYLDVQFSPYVKSDERTSLYDKVNDWAWEAYSYSGAGDGSDYGDDIVYDLVNGKVTTSEWYMSITKGEETNSKLKID